MMHNLKQIKAFILVSELKSFKRAADDLSISTTAVSKQIQVLEEQLDEQLFIRSTRQVQLTDFGRQYYLVCKELEKNWLQLEALAASKKTEPHGQLKILIQNSVIETTILDRLKSFVTQFPKIELEIEMSDRELFVEPENFDILLTYNDLHDALNNFKQRKIHTVQHCLCAAPDYIQEYGMPTNINALLQHKFIIHSLRKPDNFFTLANGEEVIINKPYIKMNSFGAMLNACRQGLGIMLGLNHLIEDDLSHGRLLAVLPHLKYQQFNICLYYRSMKYDIPTVRAFCDWY